VQADFRGAELAEAGQDLACEYTEAK